MTIALRPLLLWKHRTLTNAYTLRIAEQRFTGFVRLDRQGQLYWKFQAERLPKALLKEKTTNDQPKPANENSSHSA